MNNKTKTKTDELLVDSGKLIDKFQSKYNDQLEICFISFVITHTCLEWLNSQNEEIAIKAPHLFESLECLDTVSTICKTNSLITKLIEGLGRAFNKVN